MPRQEFFDALLGEDDLGVVVRSHIYIESAVNALLDLLIPVPDQLPHLRYEQRLKLCCAMGMDKTLFPPLIELGNLRNSFGHNINTKLTNGTCSKFFEALSEADQESIAKSYMAALSGSKEALPTSYIELDPKGKLIGIALWLNATLEKMLAEAHRKKDISSALHL
jgi:hypothetical protein